MRKATGAKEVLFQERGTLEPHARHRHVGLGLGICFWYP